MLNHKAAWQTLNTAGPPALTKAIARVMGIPLNGVSADSGAGTPTSAYVSAVETGNDVSGRKTVLTITALPITLTDNAGVVVYGGTQIYDFPAGLIVPLGATVVGTLTGYAALANTFASNTALGTVVASNNATLTSTEADIMVSAANGTAAADIAAVSVFSTTNVAPINGTATAADMFLNVVIADLASPGNGTGYFTGTVTLFWRNLGDV